MKRSLVVRFVLALALPLLAAPAARAAEHMPPGFKPAPALAPFRALAGDWVMSEQGRTMTINYRVTGSGTAVVETLFPGTPHEMTTVYTQEGGDLLLTHYCDSGNQPRMRAKTPGGKVVDFAFDGGANFDPAKDPHMHEVKFTFIGPDAIQAEWTSWADGKPSGTKVFHLTRRK